MKRIGKEVSEGRILRGIRRKPIQESSIGDYTQVVIWRFGFLYKNYIRLAGHHSFGGMIQTFMCPTRKMLQQRYNGGVIG